MSSDTIVKNDAQDPVFFATESQSDMKGSSNPQARPGNVSENDSQRLQQQPQSISYPQAPATPNISVNLTYDALSLDAARQFIASPDSGANVFFTGTTRRTFSGRQVTRLEYSAYSALALRTMLKLCQSVQERHGLEKIYLVHRLGNVDVGDESIIIAVSSPHRKAAWDGGEDLLEAVKEKVEIWKREWFLDGGVSEGKDGDVGREVVSSQQKGDAGTTAAVEPKERGEWRSNAERDGKGELINASNMP